MTNYLIIGNPENRRIALFQSALQRLSLPKAKVLSYQSLLNDADSLAVFFKQWSLASHSSQRLCLRLESPGENADVEQQLIERGMRLAGRVRRWRYELGRIQHSKFWFAGFSDLLNGLAGYTDEFEEVSYASHPFEILLAFDKPRCHSYLARHGIAVPSAIAEVTCFDELISQMRERNWNRVFIKLASGSSASGVVALHRTGTGVHALTSMEMIGSGQRAKFYNNLKLQLYTRQSHVKRIVDFLCECGAHVERWLPKAALVDRNFDLRMLTIDGQPMHCVVRTSRSPITNLHLGNRRGDLEMLRQRMSQSAWQDTLDLAVRVATLFPRSHMLGLDILLQPGFRNPTLLEVNAFGDLLPGVLHGNLDSYAAQIMLWNGRARTARTVNSEPAD